MDVFFQQSVSGCWPLLLLLLLLDSFDLEENFLSERTQRGRDRTRSWTWWRSKIVEVVRVF